MLREIGMLDEKYFLYFEEVDYCLRAARAGWECWYEPASRVVHLVAQSTGVTYGPNKPLPSYWFDSRRRYFLKNHGRMYMFAVDCVWFAGRFLWEVRRFIERKPQLGPASIIRHYARNSVFVRGFRF